MPEIHNIGGLEISQDLRHQKNEWRFEHVGWVLMGALIILSILGYTGPGIFSKKFIHSSGLSVEYQRTARYQSPTFFDIKISPEIRSDDTVRLTLNTDFIEQIELEKIDPEPVRTEVTEHQSKYFFLSPERNRASVVRFRFRGDQFGYFHVEVGAENKAKLQFTQFYFP